MWKSTLIIAIAMTATLSAEINVLAFAGSTKKESVNKKLIKNVAQIATDLGANVTVVDLKDYPIPFYDADLEASEGMPKNVKLLRNLMVQSQVIFIASPEYNHSIPAVLKNVLDWVSRSEKGERSREAFLGKKIGILSASPSKGGGAKGLIHLRDILEDQHAIVLPQQLSVPMAHTAFDEQDQLMDSKTRAELKQLIEAALKQIAKD